MIKLIVDGTLSNLVFDPDFQEIVRQVDNMMFDRGFVRYTEFFLDDDGAPKFELGYYPKTKEVSDAKP